MRIKKIVFGIIAVTLSISLQAKEHVELFPFGDMNSWVTRYIKESKAFSGKTKVIYAIAPTDTTYEAFIGHDGNVFWVDNVGLVYEE